MQYVIEPYEGSLKDDQRKVKYETDTEENIAYNEVLKKQYDELENELYEQGELTFDE